MNRTQQLDSVLSQSNAEEHRDGRVWYPDAHTYLLELSKEFKISIEKVCGVCAALSPLKSWPVNKNITRSYLEGKRNIHTKLQVSKCDWIMRGDDIEKCLGGLKTVNFFFNLLNPPDPNYCTIDRHMLWMFDERPSLTPKKYNSLKSVMIDYANTNKWVTSELQAVTWLTVKRIKQ